jgi:sortase A
VTIPTEKRVSRPPRARALFLNILASALAAAGLFALSYWGISHVKARAYQSKAARQVAPEAIDSGADKPAYPAVGSAMASLSIPRIGLSVVVVEGAGEKELALGAGHIPGTALPGDGGNVGIAAHRDSFFRSLRHIRDGDVIKLTTHGDEYSYKVVSTQIVSPDAIEVLHPVGREVLTLVTCYPFNFIGSAPYRFVVRAESQYSVTPEHFEVTK